MLLPCLSIVKFDVLMFAKITVWCCPRKLDLILRHSISRHTKSSTRANMKQSIYFAVEQRHYFDGTSQFGLKLKRDIISETNAAALVNRGCGVPAITIICSPTYWCRVIYNHTQFFSLRRFGYFSDLVRGLLVYRAPFMGVELLLLFER